MTYPRGYKLFEPLNPLSPNPSLDNLVKIFNEGTDYIVTDTSIVFTETTGTYLNGGDTEYRYFVAFDDENIGQPSNVFSIVNLMPPTSISLQSNEFDSIQVNYTNAQYSQGYKYSLKNLTINTTIVGTLPVNGLIVGLSANTPYELKLASVNSLSEQTEWSSSSQTTTLRIFNLVSTVSNRSVTWTWEYETDINTNRFELINNDTSEVYYSGLGKTFSYSDIPTQRYNVYVRVVNNDNSTRDTRLSVADVYSNETWKIDLITGTSSAGSLKTFNEIEIYHDELDTVKVNNTIFIEDMRILKTSNVLYSDIKELGKFDWSLYNWRKDYVPIKSGTVSGETSFKISCGTQVFRDFKTNIIYKPTFQTVGSSLIKFNNGIHRDLVSQFLEKQIITSQINNVISASSLTFADYKLNVKPSFYIENSRKVQYGLKLGLFNDRVSELTKSKQLFFNPTIPYDLGHVDVIFSQVTSNIDVESRVNKVRILCLGDSITAGAPLYDPQYGGTVWMSDLILGKVTTRNVIESQYPYWLQKRLGIDDFEIINEGSGRRTSAEVLFHVKRQLTEYKPQFVLIMIGTNDIFAVQDRGVDVLQDQVNSTLFNIRKTVDEVLSANAVPVLGTQLPRNSIVPLEAKNALRNLNIGIKNLGIEKVIDIIDWYDVFVLKNQNGIETGVLRYDLTGDDTHPTVQGYKTMAYAINLGIFNSFRANLRLFGKLKGEDVDYTSEESRTQPDPYSLNYTITYPQMRRLQNYVYSKYIKNTGNSWGMFALELNDPENVAQVWDAKNKVWTRYFVGQLAPNQIMELKMKYTMPATGSKKEVDVNIDYLVKK